MDDGAAPIAFPQHMKAYGLENATDRGYEWMIGEAMLATPRYGNDCATATTSDVYLPVGHGGTSTAENSIRKGKPSWDSRCPQARPRCSSVDP
ncbi:MAG: hypothetical protein ABI197_10080, partial [Granulicella sp.]